MTDKELINKIKGLKEIQPSNNWLSLTRQNLISQFKEENKSSFSFISWFNWFKPIEFQTAALSICLILIFTAGPWLTIKASEGSLPGETLYSIKKITEELRSKVTSEESRSQLQVEFASRRLEELVKISEDSFTEEEKAEKSKELVDSLKENLTEATNYLGKISKEEAVVVAKRTKKIKEDLDRTKKEASADIQGDLAEAAEAVAEIDNQVLAVLTDQTEQSEENATTTPDQETIIFLEETETGVMTTTNPVIHK